MTMRTSAAGVAAIREREGCRLHSYPDIVAVWTIGVGHTGRASGPPVTPGMVITQEQADAFLAADLAPFEAAINAAIKRPMTQPQFDAMASLAFNIGAGGFTGSTVVHKFNAGDIQGAADAFLMWEKPAALKGRRIAERRQFLSPSTSAVMAPAPAVPTTAAPSTTFFAPPHIGVPAQPPAAAPTWSQRLASFFFRRTA